MHSFFPQAGSREAFRLPPVVSLACMTGRRMRFVSAVSPSPRLFLVHGTSLHNGRKKTAISLNVIFLQRHKLSANQIQQSVIFLFSIIFAPIAELRSILSKQTHQFFLDIFFRHHNIPLHRHYHSKMYTSSFLLVALIVPHVSEAFATLPSAGYNSRFGLKSSVRYFLNTQWNLARINHVEESCNMSKQ